MFKNCFAFSWIASLCFQCSLTNALPFPFGEISGDTFTLEGNGDGDESSSEAFDLPFPMVFFDEVVTQAFQNVNGHITFDRSLPFFTEFNIPSSRVPPMTAVYSTDIDTNREFGANELWARASTEVSDLFHAMEILQVAGAPSTFFPRAVFVATWNEVGAWAGDTSESNTFQAAVVYNELETWAILAYDQLEFYTAASTSSTVVGFNDGRGLEGKLIKNLTRDFHMDELLSGTNCDIQGTYAFKVDSDFETFGCGVFDTDSVLHPSSGPKIGGTIIQINDLFFCIEDPSLPVECKFEGDQFLEIVEGFLVGNNKIECITPFRGEEASVDVFYRINHPNFTNFTYEIDDDDEIDCYYFSDFVPEECFEYWDFDSFKKSNKFEHMKHFGKSAVRTDGWIPVKNNFLYFGDQAGIAIGDTVANPLITAGTSEIARWSTASLILSSTVKFDQTNLTFSNEDIKVDLEFFVYNESSVIDRSPSFQKFHSLSVSSPLEANSFTFSIENDMISPFLSQDSGTVEGNVALIFAQVVSYLEPVSMPDKTYVGAVGRSQVFSVILSENEGICEFSDTFFDRKEECNFDDQEVTPPCPPSYNPFIFFEINSNFSPDGACVWPAGDQECDVTFDIQLETQRVCLDFVATSEFIPEYCENIPTDFDVDVSVGSCMCSLYHNGATGCARSGKTQCCYGSDGGLLTNPYLGAGTADCVGLGGGVSGVLGHIWQDVVPYWIYCKLCGDCDEYFEERPPITSEGYEPPPPPGWMSGDPHVITFDGSKYTFNGAGEYVAICGSSISQSTTLNELVSLCAPSASRLSTNRNALSVHFRFSSLLNEVTIPGTVTVGVAIEDPLHGVISVVLHPTRRIDVFDESSRVIFPEATGGGNTVSITLPDGTNMARTADLTTEEVKVSIRTPSGLFVSIRETQGVMLPSISLPQILLNGNSIGLLGSADGDPSNDFTNSDGVIVDVSNIEDQSDITETLFNDFGLSWMISFPDRSLFRALDDSTASFFQFYDPFYVPLFEPPVMTQALQEQADEVCGNVDDENVRENCYFDIAVTEDPGLVSATTSATLVETQRLETIINSPPTLSGDSNQIQNIQVGEVATFTFDVSDADGQSISVTLNRNDGGLFDLAEIGQDSYEIKFNENNNASAGSFAAVVSITDGLTPILFTATVDVERRPTLEPTFSPTKSPTDSPSKSPTDSPSKSPTASPTKSFNSSPTASPNTSPTASPTKSINTSETASPTMSPSKEVNQTMTPSAPTAAPTQSQALVFLEVIVDFFIALLRLLTAIFGDFMN